MRHRYITSGLCEPTDPVCNYRLISHREIGSVAKEVGRILYRVNIPDNLKLEKWACDTYATTNDKRTIRELGYDYIVTMHDGKRKRFPKEADVNAIAKEEVEKWRELLYKDYNSAYHPYPKSEEDVNLDKQVYAKFISKTQKENPKAANALQKILDEKYGKGWEQSVESNIKAWAPSKDKSENRDAFLSR